MQNHRLLVSIVVIMGVLVLVGATTLSIFAFKKMKSTSQITQNKPLVLGKVTVEGISASTPHLYLLLKDKLSHNYKICIIDETTGTQKGQIALDTQ